MTEVRKRILIASVAALTVLVVGIVAIAARSTPFRAQADVLITPITTNPSDSVAGVDTLSRGTAVATYAEALRSAQVVDPALAAAGIAEPARPSITIRTQVVAGTSIVRVTAESRYSDVVAPAADAIAAATPLLGGYSSAFGTQRIDAANGESSQTGPSGGALIAIILLLALGAGVGVHYLLGRWGDARAHRRSPAPAVRPAANPPVPHTREHPRGSSLQR